MKTNADHRSNPGHVVVWSVRIAWVALALIPGPVGDALVDSGRTAQVVFTVMAWVLWAIGVVASAWLSPVSLTTIRSILPACVVGLVVATFVRPEQGDASLAGPLASVLLAIVATFVAFLPDYGAAHVQAAAYGAERRLPLRVPIPHVAPMALTWLVTWGAITGLLFAVAAEVWLVALVVGVATIPLAWLAATRFHRFSRRWLVVVPAGVVVHDHVLLAETFMVRSHAIVGVELSDLPGAALDLTGVARGSLVTLSLRETENLALSPYLARMLGTLDAVHVRSFSVAPTLTGQALAALTKPPATT